MMYLLVLLVELVFLWLLSRRLTQNLYASLFLVTKSRTVSISFLSVLFFAGTVIHELAHMFVAEILGVRTSGLTLVPEGLENKEVKTGSVSIAQSDPIRRAVIGIAPVFVGLAALGVISYFLTAELTGVPVWGILEQYNNVPVVTAILAYLLFAVSNTMFASPEDMEGFWPVAIVVLLFGVSAYFIGLRITFTDTVVNSLNNFLLALATNVGWVVGANIILFLLSKLLIAGAERLTGRRLAPKS